MPRRGTLATRDLQVGIVIVANSVAAVVAQFDNGLKE
jgi:hypothetical protein